MTYSIVARDNETGMLGVGIQSHFFSAASVAVFAEPGVGVMTAQSFALRQYGGLGLKLLAAGQPSEAVLHALLRLDNHPETRQIGIVDAQGRAAGYTGAGCVQPASHCAAPGVCAQGNMLAAPNIADAMVEAYQSTAGDLAERILAALDAAQAHGGDARGMQSAGLRIVGGEATGQPWNGMVHDERVDDHPQPLVELRRLVNLRRKYRPIGALLFDDGPFFGDASDTPPESVASAVESLKASAIALGDSNHEATLWQAVLMARHQQAAEAAELIGPLLSRQPTLAVFIRGLVAGGMIDAAAGAVLLQAR